MITALQTNSIDIAPQTWQTMREQASALVKSGFLPNSIKTPEQAVAIMIKGRELGIPAMQSLSQINIIQGKPTISAELMLALIYRTFPAAKIDFEKLDNSGCVIKASRPGGNVQTFSFCEADAKSAQLLSKDNWKKYPRAMYRSRAVSEMARSLFPDCIMGCSYTPEELGAETNDEGEVIKINPETREPTKPKVIQMQDEAASEQEAEKLKAAKEMFVNFCLKMTQDYELTEEQVLAKFGISPDDLDTLTLDKIAKLRAKAKVIKWNK